VTARQQGDFDVACVYAGEGVGLLVGEKSAAAVVAEFAEAQALLDRAAGR
jgi:nitronate monooxygenase